MFRRVTVPLLAPVLTRRLHHDGDQRPEGVRHRPLRRARLGPGRRQRDRARDVADGVRRQSTTSASARRSPSFLFVLVIPVLAAQHPPLQEGGVAVAAVGAEPHDQAPAARAESVAREIAPRRREGAGAVILLAAVGLAVARPDARPVLHVDHAGRASSTPRAGGRSIAHPSLATLEELPTTSSRTHAITHSLLTTLRIAIGGTVLPIFVAALAGYAFAWLEFPGRDWLFIGVIALLVVPLQMALIPIFSLYNRLGIFDTVVSLILFHTGVRAAVRDLPAPELLHRAYRRTSSSRRGSTAHRNCASSSG